MADDPLSKVKTKYIDRPDLTDTYVDAVGMCSMYHGVYRMEFVAIRLDEPTKPPKNPPTGRKYPVARLALPVPVVIDLFTNLENLMTMLEKDGQIVRHQSGPATVQ